MSSKLTNFTYDRITTLSLLAKKREMQMKGIGMKWTEVWREICYLLKKFRGKCCPGGSLICRKLRRWKDNEKVPVSFLIFFFFFFFFNNRALSLVSSPCRSVFCINQGPVKVQGLFLLGSVWKVFLRRIVPTSNNTTNSRVPEMKFSDRMKLTWKMWKKKNSVRRCYKKKKKEEKCSIFFTQD